VGKPEASPEAGKTEASARLDIRLIAVSYNEGISRGQIGGLLVQPVKDVSFTFFRFLHGVVIKM
jgi:hypothetical protein